MTSRLAAFRARVAERVAGMDEEEAAAWIAGHGLLSMAGCGDLPEGVRERLRERNRHATAYSLFAIERFRKVADVLAGSDPPIPACPLKGVFLLGTIYRDDPGSRPLGDLDLLVPAERIDDAVRRLESVLGLTERRASRRLRRFYPERVLTGDVFEIELHDRLGYKHGAASTWSALAPAPAEVHGRPVYALDRETTLVHLVSHLVKHRPLSRLIWIEDVLRWADPNIGNDLGGDLDGARAMAVATRIGARRSLIAGVRVLRRLAGDDLLPGVPGDAPGLGLHERWLWPDLVERAPGSLPDPPHSTDGGGSPSPAGGVLSSVLLADRPSQAVRAVAVKAAEIAFRGRRSH